MLKMNDDRRIIHFINENDSKKRIVGIFLFFFLSCNVFASQLYVGAASVSILPPLPVTLAGQRVLRIAKDAQTPLTANIIALENKDKNRKTVKTVWVSVDLIMITPDLESHIRKQVEKEIPGLDVDKIIISAIHTHTAPATRHGFWESKDPNVTNSKEAVAFISDKIAKGIKQSWDNLGPASMTWGLGHASIAINRRATYADGSASMYGQTNTPKFRGLEGPSPDDVNVLFFWNNQDQLIATVVNVPCPAQTVEHRTSVNADYWYPVRQSLRKRFGDQLVVLGTIGAAGDQSPHAMIENAAEKRMRDLQHIDRLHQLGNRVVEAVEDVYDIVKNDRHSDIKMDQKVEKLQLPMSPVSIKAYKTAKKHLEKLESDDQKTKYRLQRWIVKNRSIVDRYEHRKANFPTTVHVLRLGDVAVCTSRFELFTKYGQQIKARSKAVQTINIELAGEGTYLPTPEAVKGRGYSANWVSNHVGPEAGEILVEHIVNIIDQMWLN